MSDVSLTGWMKALIAYVRSGEPDLTNRQMALLMLVYLTPGPHTVRGLARVLGVSKPVVTRALNTLVAIGEPFAMLDESLGWAWGYAGKERRVGYVRSEALG